MEIIDYVLWVFLPVLIGVMELFFTSVLTRRRRTFFNYLASIFVFFLNIYAIWIFIEMFFGGWATYLPYIFIVASTVIIAFQIIYKEKTHHNNI